MASLGAQFRNGRGSKWGPENLVLVMGQWRCWDQCKVRLKSKGPSFERTLVKLATSVNLKWVWLQNGGPKNGNSGSRTSRLKP